MQSEEFNPDTKPTQSADDKLVSAADDGFAFDREKLANASSLFLKINNLRLSKTADSLTSSQRVFVDVLPLLFHLNHVALPGYCGHDTPAGLSEFKVERQHVKAARGLAKSFTLDHSTAKQAAIRSIFLMGSCGSLGQSESSDFDIWIVPANHLDDAQTQALRKKCDAISAWALSLGLEVHFFIMDDKKFREQQRATMNKEDCGTTQHYLLLDEFYRTGILVAGCQPLWWHVPCEHDTRYADAANHLVQQRYLRGDQCIDFGSTNTIPPSEFVSAGIWNLYKAVASPYKALMKLLLIEVYATEYPATQTLCNQFKQAVYDGRTDIDDLDPYLLIYRRIEAYLLARSETDRLELLRRCFYYKVGIKLSRQQHGNVAAHLHADAAPQQRVRDWKRTTMTALVSEWGWSGQQIAWLDDKENWPFKHIRAEQQKLTRELINSYRLLCLLVKNHHTDTAQPNQSRELTLLGRQLYAAFEQKPNKIPQSQCSVVSQVAKPTLSLMYTADGSNAGSWSVLAPLASTTAAKIASTNATTVTPESNDTQETLKTTDNVIELLVWCLTNKIADRDTRLSLTAGEHHISDSDLRQLYAQLKEHCGMAALQKDDRELQRQFAKPAHTTECLFIINCDTHFSSAGGHSLRLNDQIDPLTCDAGGKNLLQHVTLLTKNNWNEIYCYHYEGDHAVDQSLARYFSLCRHTTNAIPSRRFYCANSSYPTTIVNRLETLFDDIEQCFFSADKTTNRNNNSANLQRRYIFESSAGYHTFYWQDGEPRIAHFDSQQMLLDGIDAHRQSDPISIDRFALKDHPLHAIQRKLEASTAKATAGQLRGLHPENRICVFYEVVDQLARTYIFDQRRAFAYAELPFESTRAFVLPMARFIEQSSLRRFSSDTHAIFDERFVDHESDLDASIEDVEKALAKIEHFDSTRNLNVDQQLPNIEFYALTRVTASAGNSYSVTRLPTEADISANYLSIKAIGQGNSSGELSWSIYCNDEVFSQERLGEQFFMQVAESIASRRQAGQQRYRCYITDIEINTATPTDSQTLADGILRDFYYKNKLEARLNDAFLNLP